MHTAVHRAKRSKLSQALFGSSGNIHASVCTARQRTCVFQPLRVSYMCHAKPTVFPQPWPIYRRKFLAEQRSSVKMASHSCAGDCESAHIAGDISGQTSRSAHDSLAWLPICSSSDSSSEVPAPSRFVRRQSSNARLIAPAPSVKAIVKGSSNVSPHTTYGVGEDMWSFFGPLTSTHGMQSKYYAAHRRHVATLLTSSDAAQDQNGDLEGWDDALDALTNMP
jgi:hypothetical protein